MAATDGRTTVSGDCCQTQDLVCEVNPLSSVYRPIDASSVYIVSPDAGESAMTAVPGEIVVGGSASVVNQRPSIGRPIDTSQVHIVSPAGESATTADPGEVADVVVGGCARCASCSSVPEACSRAACDDCSSSVHDAATSKPLVTQVTRTEAARVDAICTSHQAAELTDSAPSSEALAQEVEAAKMNACATIQKAFDELHKVMEERRRELLAGVEGISDAKKTALARRNRELKMLRSEMTEYCEVATHTLDAYHGEEEVAPLWELLTTEMRSVQDRMEALPPLLVTPELTTAIVDPTHVMKEISKLGKS